MTLFLDNLALDFYAIKFKIGCMNFIKLQISCLLVTFYIIWIYLWQTKDKKIPENKIFKLLIIFIPLEIIFDGVTAWTVNHTEIVPHNINIILHAIFFTTPQLCMPVILYYILNEVRKVPKTLFSKILIFIPAIVFEGLILAFIPELNFIQGKTTWYSFGASVIAVYICIMLYFLMIFILTIIKIKNIESRKRVCLISVMSIIALIITFQLFFPEILLTSLIPTFFAIGLYVNIEDPALKRLKVYNNATVSSFATLVENRDSSTGGHVKRTQNYVKVLLDEIKKHPSYSVFITKDFEENVFNASPMHDIGKISTPDTILQKPGKLTDEEYAIMKEHAKKGGEIIQETFKDLEEPEFLQIAYEVARFHHEKWNGKGYPDGKKEFQIPFAARIMAIADVFDAVSAKRCYRDALPLETCFKIIQDGSGTDFDPELVKCFFHAKDKIIKVYNDSNQQ